MRAEPLVDDDLDGEHDDQDGKQREYGRKEVGRQRTAYKGQGAQMGL